MHPITDQLTRLISTVLTEANLDFIDQQITWERPANSAFGDYSTNIALKLYQKPAGVDQKIVGLSKPELTMTVVGSPRGLAQLIVTSANDLLASSDLSKLVADISVAGPGFINVRLSNQFLLEELKKLVSRQPSSFGFDDQRQQQPIVVEYSSPNIAKPFTIGHLRSTIIGDALANLFTVMGYQVFRDNHLGDWGTQFGKLIYAIKTWGSLTEIEQSERPVKLLVELYVKFHAQAEQRPELEDEGRAWFKRLEDGDPEARRLWQQCIDWSWQEFNQIYQRLGVKFTENDGRGYGESFFEDKMSAVITELKNHDLLSESEGAQLVFFPEDKYPPLMIMKKDGSTLYATRDLATDRFRLDHYGPTVKIVNEVGSEQSLYFKQLFEIESMLGWVRPGQRVHVGHGLYRFKDGKMSTRKGNVVWLEDVLEEAFERAKTVSKAELTEETVWQIAMGALKWNDLKREANKPVVFDFDEILALKGFSGPYVQYMHVRCQAVLTKWNTQVATDPVVSVTKYLDTLLDSEDMIDLDDLVGSTGIDLLRNLYHYSETLEQAALEYAPHHICTYLFELAQSFSRFYDEQQIVPPNTDPTLVHGLRLGLTVAVASVIEHGLAILGIKTVEKM